LLLLAGGSWFSMFSMFSVVFGCAVSRFLSRIAYTGVVSAGKATVASAAAGSHLDLSWWWLRLYGDFNGSLLLQV
jgi:hypothetical protein